jgi:hypothetical protein
MAITVSSAAADAILRIEWRDYRGETVVQNIALDPALDPTTDIIPILTALDGLSNAIMVKASFLLGTGFTGMNTTPGTGLQPLVAAREILTFTKVNPLNAAKTVTRQVGIPAYADALVDVSAGTPYHPVSTDSAQNGLTAALAAGLNYKGSDGLFYPGGWTYALSQSGFITVGSETDGLPG